MIRDIHRGLHSVSVVLRILSSGNRHFHRADWRKLAEVRRTVQHNSLVGQRLRLVDNSLFQLLDNGNEGAGFKGLDDHAIGFNTVGVFGPVGLHLAHGQQNRGLQRLDGGTDLLAHFKARISRHVDIQDDNVRFVLCDLLDRSSAIADSDDVISCIRQDLFAHILGSHAVVSK